MLLATQLDELAVRLALGASRREAVWTVMRPCAAVLGAGSALGFLGAVSVGPALTSLLHGVGPADGFTLTIAPVLLGAIVGAKVLRTDLAGQIELTTDGQTIAVETFRRIVRAGVSRSEPSTEPNTGY